MILNVFWLMMVQKMDLLQYVTSMQKKITLWQWDKSRYLVPVKIGRKVFYRKGDIDKLYDYKH